MKEALKKSIMLHLAVLILFMIDLPLFWSNRTPPGQVPIIVDLKDIKISEMTNLPPKAKLGKEDRAASTIKRKIEDKYTKDEPAKSEGKKAEETPKPEPKKETVEKPKQDFLVAPQPKKPVKAIEKKAQKATAAKKQDGKKKEAKANKQLANPLKSLLASVDALQKDIGPTSETAVIKEGTEVNNMGIEGGTTGSYFSELSISEMDAIAGRLRGCWNLDPGARGIEDMIVEIKAVLNQDGTVRRVDILDTGRYNSDTHFRSVADSAKRAVYICAPYTILAEKYSEKYNLWSTLLLRFNPMDASVQ